MMVLSTPGLVGMVVWLSGVFSEEGVARSTDAEVVDLSEGQRATHTGKEPEGPGSSESPKVGMRLTAVNSKPTGGELLAEYTSQLTHLGPATK